MTGVFKVLAVGVTRGRIVLATGGILDKCGLRRGGRLIITQTGNHLTFVLAWFLVFYMEIRLFLQGR